MNASSKVFYHGQSNGVRIDYHIDDDDSEVTFCHMAGRVCFIDMVRNENIGNGDGGRAIKDFIRSIHEMEDVNSFHLSAIYESKHYSEKKDRLGNISRLVNFYKRLGFVDLVDIDDGMEHIDMFLTIEQGDQNILLEAS